MAIDDSKRKVDSDKLIVEHAAVICSYAQKAGVTPEDSPKQYIHLIDTHGVDSNGLKLAHDGNCKNPDNIGRFRHCYSPYYASALSAIRKGSAEELAENKAEAEKAKYRKVNKCLGRYVDQWFDVDEKKMIDTYLGAVGKVSECLSQFRKEYRNLKNTVYDIIGTNSYNTNRYSANKTINEIIEKNIEDIDDTYMPAINIIEDNLFSFDENFTQQQSALIGLENNLESIDEKIKKVKEDLKTHPQNRQVDQFGIVEGKIQDVLELIDDAPNEIEKWKAKPYYLLTTESYLVCKCGGILSFYSNGQEYNEINDRIVRVTEDLVTFIRQCCTQWHEVWQEIDVEPPDTYYYNEKNNELRNSEQALNKVQELESGSGINPAITTIDDAYQGIHIEYWSHAYFEEQTSLAIGLLSIVSLRAPSGVGIPLSMALTFYQYVRDGNGDKRPLKWTDGNDVLTFWSGYLEYYATQGSKLANNLGVFNKVVSAATIPSMIFYTSNATWVEEIQITFFTDDFACVFSQKINEEGYKVGNPIFKKCYKHEYQESPDSDGIMWKISGEEGEDYDTYVFTPTL